MLRQRVSRPELQSLDSNHDPGPGSDARCRFTLGWARLGQGKRDEALAEMERGVALSERCCGPNESDGNRLLDAHHTFGVRCWRPACSAVLWAPVSGSLARGNVSHPEWSELLAGGT